MATTDTAATTLPAEEQARRRRIEALEDPATYTPPALSCDVIMKGGITSGVVYPLAVAELATTYRFANIGGTSAGAIAAAGAAAAAYEGTGAGFAKLAALPERLGRELQALFRPQKRTRRLFRLATLLSVKASGAAAVGKWVQITVALLAFAGSVGGSILIGGSVAAAVALGVLVLGELGSAWVSGPATVAAVLAALVIGALLRRRAAASGGAGARSWRVLAAVPVPAVVVASVVVWGGAPWLFLAWLVPAVVVVLVAVATAVVREAGAVLPENDFGLVGGSSLDTKPSDVRPLSEWLDDLLREVSGGNDPLVPLTFGQLADTEPGINLTLLTTCLSRGRTYYLPWDFAVDDDRPQWFFDPQELRRALPDNIVAYLCEPDDYDDRQQVLEALTTGEPLPGEPGDSGIEHAVWPLRPLPAPADLPVLVATRMSLSFPVLVSAVPLRSIDWTLEANYSAADAWEDWFDEDGPAKGTRPPADRPTAEKCWFSDGGIISNFPVHLFDSMIPGHPTFGINLRGYHPDREDHDRPDRPESEKIFRPQTNGSGQLEWWSRWPDHGFGAIGGFLAALKNTIQNWSDNDQMRVPGFRDRVVHVSHNKAEGGLNLAMPANVIDALGRRGHAAASELSDAFSVADPPVVTGWRNHKWIRFRSAMALLGSEIEAIVGQYTATDPTGVESYHDLVRLDNPPSYDGIKAQRKTLRELIEGRYDDRTDPAGPGLQGAATALAKRAARYKGADLEVDAPGPLPSLQIVPGHKDAPDR